MAGALCKGIEEYLEEMLFFFTCSGQSLVRLAGEALLSFVSTLSAQDRVTGKGVS